MTTWCIYIRCRPDISAEIVEVHHARDNRYWPPASACNHWAHHCELSNSTAIHCMQAVRQPHVYRVQAYSYFSIPARLQSTSFFHAPGSREAINGLPMPTMCVAFCSAHGIQSVRAVHALCAKQSLELFNACLSATLVHFQGYRCKERNGIHMLAFHSVRACGHSCISTAA
jgi:hypothetical protein